MANARIKPIVMPKWGLTMSEGKVTSWHKNPGDAVAVGDEILEVGGGQWGDEFREVSVHGLLVAALQ